MIEISKYVCFIPDVFMPNIILGICHATGTSLKFVLPADQ